MNNSQGNDDCLEIDGKDVWPEAVELELLWPAAQSIISSGYMLQEMSCLINFKIVMRKMQQLNHS
ncbi:hypothetical protein LINPERHAP2_LOCUS33070 [Linum perenne]